MDNIREQQEQPRTSGAKTKVKPKEEMTFVKTLVASMLGFMAGIIGLSIISLIGFLLLLGSLSSVDGEPTVLGNSLLVLPMKGSIPEVVTAGSFGDIFSKSSMLTTHDYLTALETAANDEHIAGVWLQFEGFSGGIAQIEALARGLNKFKESGKFIYATSNEDGYNEAEYILATCADSLFLPRSGAIELNGFYLVLEYYKPLLDKLNIKPIMVRAGRYKSFVEPFTRTSTSPEYEEVVTSIIDARFARGKRLVADGRNISVAEVDSIVANWPLLRPDPAFQLKLIDRILYDDEVENVFKTRLYQGDTSRHLRTIEVDDYVAGSEEDDDQDVIALVYANGSIATGKSEYNPIFGGNQLGSQTFVEEMRKVRENENVKAIVLRINSPGGALPPSIMIWREVKLAAETKPVIVSMANVAASGGYYIAAPAHEIIAEETTITGSIGVFALAFNIDGFYEKTLGINTQVYRTGPHADILSLLRDPTQVEMRFAEAEIDTVYNQFLNAVAEGRNMSPHDVDSIAQGRIWTGLQAKEVGLVDAIGGLELAFERAAEKAGIDDYAVRIYPEPKDKFQLLLEIFDIGAQGMEIRQLLEADHPMALPGVRTFITKSLQEYSGLQARLVGFNFE